MNLTEAQELLIKLMASRGYGKDIVLPVMTIAVQSDEFLYLMMEKIKDNVLSENEIGHIMETWLDEHCAISCENENLMDYIILN